MHTIPQIRTAIRYILVGLAVLLPLFFLPYTLEVLELNKHFLLYAGVLIALMLWLLEGAITRKFRIVRSAFDVYVLGFLTIVFVSGLFSVDRTLSFIGDYNNIQVGVLPLLFLCLYAFLVTQVFENCRSYLSILYGFAIGGGVSALWFAFDKLGYFGFTSFGVRFSNTVSVSNSEFGIFLVLLVLGAVAMLSLRKHNILLDILTGIVGAVAFVVLLSLGFTITYVMLVIGLGLLLAFMLTYVDFLRMPWITVTFGLVVLSVLFIFLNTPRILSFDLPVEVSLGVGTSYSVAWDTLTDNTKQFLLGSGPSTYVYDFSHYRPEALNMNSFAWRVRFAKPYATAVSFVAELGVLGVISFVFLVLIALGFIGSRWLDSMGGKKEKPRFDERVAFVYIVAPLWLTTFVSFFFVHASIVLWFAWFAMLAMLSAALVKGHPKYLVISLKSSPQYVLATSFTVVLLFAGAIVFGVFAGRYYAAEMMYTKAQKSASSPAQAISMLSRAVQLNDESPRYRVALAQAFLNEARVVAGQADGSPDLITRLVASAIDEAKSATAIAPKSVNTWETLAEMYANAQSFAPGVNVWVARSYEKAVEFEPSNPLLRLALGRAKYAEGKNTEALDEFQESVALKPNYIEAYLQLSGYYEAEGDIASAVTELEKGLAVGRQSDAYLFQLGRLYFNRAEEGDWDRALALFNASLALNPNNVNALFSTGLVFDRRGERSTALKFFEEVLKRDPTHEAVVSRVKQLRAILGIQ